MEDSFKQITKALSANQAKKCVENYGSVVIVEKTENGIEIRDMRKLSDRLEKQINNKGIVYYLGDHHFIITPKRLEQLKQIVNIVDIQETK
jgi:SMC interacting uncharacterized protein involved in chromosome segregation